MKKWTILLIMMLVVTLPATGAMSIGKMRQNTRFLTDRMAYELKLSPQQYDDVYEVNYDFINNVRYLMDDVVRGYDYALDRYYDFLDVRNDDLRWILSRTQYRRFMGAEHFYRPIYAHSNKWNFRIYLVYHNVNFFYYGKPHHYSSYCGGHYRTHFHNESYYKKHHHKRYGHDVYDGHYRIRHDRATYDTHRRRDFKVAVRPGKHPDRNPSLRPDARPSRSDVRPNVRPDVRPDARPDNRPPRRESAKPDVKKERRENSRREKRENKSRERGRDKSNDRSAMRTRTV